MGSGGSKISRKESAVVVGNPSEITALPSASLDAVKDMSRKHPLANLVHPGGEASQPHSPMAAKLAVRSSSHPPSPITPDVGLGPRSVWVFLCAHGRAR